VRQWESTILEYSEMYGHDPDLIAAVIWKESRGDRYARGPAGAVGLMQVMPREAGFSWRPRARELQEPWRNVFWGSRALAIVIGQSNADIYNALAAYNGGWAQIHLRGPRRFAGEILSDYARAVAMRCGLPAEGHWVATIASMSDESRSVLTILGPHRPIARYGNWPVAASMADTTTDGPPTAVVYTYPWDEGIDCRVGIWIMLDGQVIHERDEDENERSSLSDRPYLHAEGPSELLRTMVRPDA